MKKMMLVIFGVLVAAGPRFLAAQNVELEYSTYLGGSSADYIHGCALDPDDCLYIVGNTASSDFPTMNPYQAGPAAYSRVFVSKFSSFGALFYSTCLEGSNSDSGRAVSVDSSGSAYIAGETKSNDFPTQNPYQPGLAGIKDAFIVRLSSSGSSLVFSTYLGGTGGEGAEGIAVNTLGRVYIAGWTSSSSPDFPTKTAYQASYAGGVADAFVTKLHSDGSSLIFSTYLGGDREDQGYEIAVDSTYRAYVTGWTDSDSFPTRNAYQNSKAGSRDVFLTTFSLTGSSLLSSTYLGGSGSDSGYGIALDENDTVFLAGDTYSPDFPTVNPYQAGPIGAGDVFFASFSASQSTLVLSTYLGGTGNDNARDVAVDPDGRGYLIGMTNSLDFPTQDPYQTGNDAGDDVFVTAFEAGGSALFYSTYLGGDGDDWAAGIALGTNGAVYLAGDTDSTDFPTANAFQGSFNGSLDAFAAVLRLPSSRCLYHTDFNGDGTSDIAIFRGDTGLWAIREITRIYFGSTLDQAVPRDFDGDGITDVAIFRGSSGLWAVKDLTRVYFGNIYDFPRPGDYDGDGTADIGIFRETSGLWAIRDVTRSYFGTSGDNPAPGYYDGDKTMDIALFRPDSGLWAIRNISRVYFGETADTPVAGDYNGDGQWEATVFRPSSGLWAVRNLTRAYFGSGVDQPRPADYDGDGLDDIGIFRGSLGLWAVKDVTRVYFGDSGDDAVTR